MSTNRRQMALWSGGAALGSLLLPQVGRATPEAGSVLTGDGLPAVEASWYRKLDGTRVECQLCPRGCAVADAERGSCGTRENRGGTYFTLVHSLACSVHADPIEKKPFFHVMPGEMALSFATAGCNVECKFCQNWQISQFRPEQLRNYYLPPDVLVGLAQRSSAKLIAATYSEPVVFWEYVRDAARAARKADLHPTVVSNGYIQEKPLREVLPLLSAMKVDLKAFTERFYKEQVRGELKPVLAALELIRKAGVWLEIVVLLIPGLNDSAEEIREMSAWVKANLGTDVPVHFTRFHPTYRLKNLPPTPVATLERAYETAREAGLEFVYLGNVPGHPAESTRCPKCDIVLIRRAGLAVVENRLVDGTCPNCKHPTPGVWG